MSVFFGRRRRPHLRPLFLLALFSIGTGTAGAEPPRPPILCPLDFLSGQFAPGGSVTLVSWAADPMSGAPVARMEVWLDRSIRGDVRLAGYRPDVASHFGRGDYFLSGWIATVSLRDVEPGSHRVEVFAYRSGGDGVSCGARDFTVRAFPRPFEPPPWRIVLTLLARAAAFVGWLAFVGWGPLRLAGAGRVVRIAPAVGLSLCAVTTEAGAVAGMRPLAAALVLTVLSGILLAISTRSCAIRLRSPGRFGAIVAAMATIFALVGSLPLVRHGPGSVLGSINDAAWECSVADSIARYGWTPPTDVHGLLAAVPAAWRAANFRAGVPYPLALLAQVFGVRAHEVHSVLTIAIGALVICAAAALAGYLFRRLGWLQSVTVGLVAVNPILFAQLYYQHTGILIATLLYLSFVYCLIALIPRRPLASILPAGLLLAGAWTLYPETMVLWSVTAALVLVVSGSLTAVKRTFVRLALALVLAAAVNPVGLARTVRFTNALRHASALATADLRTAFGDTHYFPSPLVMAGIRPYRIDWQAPSGSVERPIGLLAACLLLATGVTALSRANARDWRLLLVLLAPVSLWLLMNRLWKFPYGYSKGLPHIAPLGSLALAILVARAIGLRSMRWARPLVIVALSLLAVVSISGSVAVVGQAFRSVPGYDSAFRSLPELVKGIDRNAVIVASEPLDFRREWMAYFLGEYRVVRSREKATSPSSVSAAIYELFDRRNEQPVPRSRVVRSNAFFALVRS